MKAESVTGYDNALQHIGLGLVADHITTKLVNPSPITAVINVQQRPVGKRRTNYCYICC